MRDLFNRIRKALLILLFLSPTACSYLVSSTTDEFGRNLKQAMVNHNDPQIVAEAIPAYLLLQESLLVKDPDNKALLIGTANLYSSYATLMEELPEKRKQRLSQKAFDLSLHAACIHEKKFCDLNTKNYDEFVPIVEQSTAADLDILYGLGTKWVNWIQANKADWNAIAQLAQVKFIIKHVITSKGDYKDGEAYLYSAVLESLIPPALGGKPDIAKAHFKKALQLSGNKNLMVHVLYAKHYARMMFERDLHDSLLKTVINAQAEQDGLTLSNILAKQQAKTLLQSADDYF